VVCAIGGDGTIHEAINGLMKRSDNEKVKIPLGIIPAGTGNSFCLELYETTSVVKVLKHIARGVHCPIDISKITCYDENQKEEEVIYSFNSIHWGLGSKVNITAERLRWMGKAVRYTTAALLELTRGQKERAKLVIDEEGKVSEIEDDFSLIIANNIVGAAKGMKMAPLAKLNDGLVDILLFRSSSTFDLFSSFQKVYKGTHTELPFVDYKQVRSFFVAPLKKSKNQPEHHHDHHHHHHHHHHPQMEIAEEIIDIDGELKGHTPFLCEVISQAIRVIV